MSWFSPQVLLDPLARARPTPTPTHRVAGTPVASAFSVSTLFSEDSRFSSFRCRSETQCIGDSRLHCFGLATHSD
jgi:hypothetical protein